jgi:hypothetical protein
MSPEQQLALVLGRLEANRGGIVLWRHPVYRHL